MTAKRSVVSFHANMPIANPVGKKVVCVVPEFISTRYLVVPISEKFAIMPVCDILRNAMRNSLLSTTLKGKDRENHEIHKSYPIQQSCNRGRFAGSKRQSDWSYIHHKRRNRGVKEMAESRLADLFLPSVRRTGAVFVSTSGGAVAKKYKYSRNATEVTLHRRAGGWYLHDLAKVQIYPDGGAKACKLKITKSQADEVERRFKAGYSVISSPTEAPAPLALTMSI
jgi:hypothetical protein